MKLVSLVVIIFPVTVAILALLIGYFMWQADNRIGKLKLAVESDTNIMHSSSMFTLGNNKTLLDPYKTADKLLLDATSLFDSGDSGWCGELNGTNWTVESTYTGDNSPLHRIRLRLESKKNVSTVFKTLTDESFLSSLYPVKSPSCSLSLTLSYQ